MTGVYYQQNYIEHGLFGKKNENHKYYARIDTGEKTFMGTPKYRYFYTADEYKAYQNSVDGTKNRKLDYERTEFADTNKANDSYNDTRQKTAARYNRAAASIKPVTKEESAKANDVYSKKLTDAGRKAVDETLSKNKHASERYRVEMINQQYELEKNQRSHAAKLTNIEKNREANDATAKRASDALKRSHSVGAKVKRKVNKVKNAAKKSIKSITSRNKLGGSKYVASFRNTYYVDNTGNIVKRTVQE